MTTTPIDGRRSCLRHSRRYSKWDSRYKVISRSGMGRE